MLIWDYWPGPEGGAERQCRGLSHELVRLGHDVTVMCSAGDSRGPVFDHGVKIERYGEGRHHPGRMRALNGLINQIAHEPWRDALAFWAGLPAMRCTRRRFLRQIRDRLKEGTRPDILHVHESGWLAGVAVELAQPFGIPVVAKVRNTPALETIGYNVPLRANWIDKRKSCHWIALHDELRNELLAEGFPSRQISVIPNAVDIPVESPGPLKLDQTVLSVGNFTQGAAHKGFDVLVRAWALVHETLPDARLIMAGRGDPAAWKKLGRDLGCGDSICFPGFVENPQDLYQKSSLFVLASNREGMSNALMEAQAHGLPAVVSDIPANRAVSPEARTCDYFKPGDERDLAGKIIHSLSDPERMRKMSLAARWRMEELFSRRSVTNRLLSTYQNLVNKEDAHG
jgi:glycosyltransferase involved in cell wall biosynthesis